MKRKKSAIVIAVVLSLIVTAVPVFADVDPASEDKSVSEIVVQSLYSSSEKANLTISSGIARPTGVVVGYSGVTTKISATVYLQQYNGKSWVNVASKSSTVASSKINFSFTKSVLKGYKYRTKASFYIYKGANKEHITKYSSAVAY